MAFLSFATLGLLSNGDAEFCSGTYQKSDHKFLCSFYRISALSPEIGCEKLPCLCSQTCKVYLQLLVLT